MATSETYKRLVEQTLLSTEARTMLREILRQLQADIAGGGGGKIRPLAVFDGLPDAILVGSQARCTVTAASTIIGWTILAEAVGSCVIDIWREPYAAYPPTVADTITGSAKPTLTAANKATSTTLTGWSLSLAAGDTLVFNVDSASTVKQVSLTLEVA